MLFGSLRALNIGLAAVALSTVGCADLIGLNDLDGSGGSAGPGSGGTSSGGTGSGSGGDALGGGPNCSLDVFDDREFTDACWHSFNTDLLWGGDYTIDEDGGLVTSPEAGPAWFGGASAFTLYREVTGNFRLDIVVSVFAGSAAHGEETYPVFSHVSGGILAFPARMAFEDIDGPFVDYYALKAGTLGDSPNGDVFSGVSTWYTDAETQTWPFEHGKPDAWDETGLRMCRYGKLLWTGFRTEPGIAWTPLHPEDDANGFDTTDDDLPDLEDTMYVGLLSEIHDGDASDGGARIIFTRADFTVPESFEDCTR